MPALQALGLEFYPHPPAKTPTAKLPTNVSMMVSFLTLAVVASVRFPVASGVHLKASSPAVITLCINAIFSAA